MPRLVVVGAGISGLAAARAARDAAAAAGEGLEVLVLERDAEVGGKVQSRRQGEWLVEEGPTGFLDAEPALDRLVEAAGLSKRPAERAAAHRFIVRGGKLREVAANPLKFAASGLLGPLGMLRVAGEPLVSGREDDEDESVWDFAARRLGPQAADRLIAPMVLGVFAGDAKKLSLPAAFPKMRAMELAHGSLVRAMFARRRLAREGDPSARRGGPAGPAGWLTSFEGGLAELPRRLAAADDVALRSSAPVETASPREGGGFSVRVEGETIEADALVLSGEPWASAALVRESLPGLAESLDAIPCPPVMVVALGFPPSAAHKAPRGFGALIPRPEGFRSLGVLWDSHIFPGRAPAGHLLVRVMLGGAVDPEVESLSDLALVTAARADLERLLGLDDDPVHVHVARWPRAIPQYVLGHRARVAAIEEATARAPGLYLAGNALTGIAFGKAAARGIEVGEKAARFLFGEESAARDAGAALEPGAARERTR